VRSFLEKNGDALFTWAHRGMDDHRPNTALRTGFKRLVSADGEPLKVDSATDYLERTGRDSRERMDAFVEYLIFPEAFRNDVCKGLDSRAVAELLRKRGQIVRHRQADTPRHITPRVRRVGSAQRPIRTSDQRLGLNGL
jgi:putative DNA primase/helicase